MKRIITMQDISCIGKCSLTVAIPVLSAMGIETAILPTAILSTHTMFPHPHIHDLTDQLQPMMEHWKREAFTFDGIYTGYLASFEQLEIAKQLIHDFSNNGLVVIDPCMADSGKLYAGFDMTFVEGMKQYCKQATMITPNLTEACFLLDIPYKETYDETYIQSILKQLCLLGSEKVILTGISLEEGKIGVYAYDQKENTYVSYFTNKEKTSFHGTGDLWTSTFFGACIQQIPFFDALQIACDFVQEAIHKTILEPNHNVYGVNFEQALPNLIMKMRKYQ